MTPAELTGKSAGHIVGLAELRCELHAGVAASLLAMRAAAGTAGIDLQPVSAFRTFERQLQIWNGKYSGARPLLDAHGELIDVLALSPAERITAILRWSALPGASRHHWGTDLDLIDRNSIDANYSVQLVAEEFASGGPFERLSEWLMRHAQDFGFFKPYCGVQSAVAPEPWHWSYADVAEPARAQLTLEILCDALEDSPILGIEALRPRLRELHVDYVLNVDPPRWLL